MVFLAGMDGWYEQFMSIPPNYGSRGKKGGYPMIKPIIYRGEEHRRHFQDEILSKTECMTNAALAAYYLLTADSRLWASVQKRCRGASIHFKEIIVGNISPEAYTLYAVARDIYCDTQHIHVGDLVDSEIVPGKIFQIIVNAFALRRNGLEALAAPVMGVRKERGEMKHSDT